MIVPHGWAEHWAEEQNNYQNWCLSCRALGATDEQIVAYEQRAQQYARTTVWCNSDVVTVARQCAIDNLVEGQPMPTDIPAAIERAMLRRQLRIW